VQGLTLKLCTVTNTNQLQALGEACAYTSHHIAYQRPGSTGHGAGQLAAITGFESQDVFILLNFDSHMDIKIQLTHTTFDSDMLASQLNFYTSRDFNWALCYTRHISPPLEYGAEYFATNTRGAGGAIGHHALVSGNDSDTQAAVDFRQRASGCVVTQTRTAYTLELFDYRLAFEVLQLNAELGLAFTFNFEVSDETFVFQYFCNGSFNLGSWHADRRMFCHLGITDSS
ncbi:50S ribosomal protein L18 RplR, partial [Elysia marginata]